MWVIAVLICVGWVISLCLHEFGHAITAYWGGDTSVRAKGYLTLNPLKYTEPSVSLLIPLLILMIGGIALPGGAVYINHQSLRNRRWQSAVSLAGPVANIIVAIALAVPFVFGWHNSIVDSPSPQSINTYVYPAIAYIINLNIFVVLINLLPIPGLDGFGIIEPWLPAQIKSKLSWLYRYGVWILIGLLWFARPFAQFLWQITFYFTNQLQVPSSLILLGSQQFRQFSMFLVLGIIAILWIFRDKNKDLYRRSTQLISQGKYELALDKLTTLVSSQPDNVDALILQGYTLYCLQQYDEALTAYARALEFQPNSALIYYYQGIIYKEIPDETAALKSFERSIKYNPNYADPWLEKARLLSEQQEDTEALVCIDKVIELQPHLVPAWQLKAHTLKHLDRSNEAVTAYEQALHLDPNSSAWLELAKLYENSQKTDQLWQLYERKLRLQPHNFEVWYRQGISYSRLERPKEAEKSYTQALECLKHQTKLHPRDPQVWWQQAQFLEKLQHYPEADTAYQQAANNWEKTCRRKNATAKDWYRYGLALEKINQSDQAATAYNQAITINPAFYQANYQIALIHIQNQDYPQALAACDRIVESYDNSRVWWLYADLSIKLQKYEQAIAACDRAIKIYPQFYGFWLSRGTALYYLHQYQDAIAAYDTAVQTKPTSDKAWIYKALALIKQAQNTTTSLESNCCQCFLDAMAALNQAIQINPENGDAWYNQACIYALQANSSQALSSLKQALKIDVKYRHLALKDTDLDNIRTNPNFAELIEIKPT